MSVRNGMETWARGAVTKAQKRTGPQSVKGIIEFSGGKWSKPLSAAVRKILATKRGWTLTTYRAANKAALWAYTEPTPGTHWSSGAEAVEHVESGKAERRPDDGLRALPPEDDTTLRDVLDEAEANARELTLDIRMDPSLRRAFKEARRSRKAQVGALDMYSRGRWDGVWIGWGLGLTAGVALTLLAMLTAMWWLS